MEMVMVAWLMRSGGTYKPLAPRIMEPLPLGSVAPQGWLLDQLVRQASSLSGYLSSTRNLGGFHGDSNVVNMSKWLGGSGGGPSYIASNDQWFPYWANGNVPLVSLLRAAGALDRLPKDLALDTIIDEHMRYIIKTAEPQTGFSVHTEACVFGTDLYSANVTLENAKRQCAEDVKCLGFTFKGRVSSNAVENVYFKGGARTRSKAAWTGFTKRIGWVSGHLLSEGGTQIVMALTQWGEDRGFDDRRAVARIVVQHLLYVTAYISASTVQSWAAMRWSSINTLFNYALDIILPEFGDDSFVVPYGLANTTAHLLSGAHHQARVGFDFEAYYSGKANPRSANKTVPHGSVAVWNVYDHGVNNAEGALRWPSEVYRLNGSLASGKAAMGLLTSMLDTYHAQIQGTFCADEVFCGRDPDRGTETCTVVESMASYEHSFATLGELRLQDRVERLAFNALPAALTADMWTHVYVQQANSIYAGVTHPNSTKSDAKHCPRNACSDAGGGPPAFSEIQDTQYFGVSHFPCCITNFPQGWPKFAQSTVLWHPGLNAIVIASLVPLIASVKKANNAAIKVLTDYPFGDTAKVTVTAPQPVVVAIRIPGWAEAATVDGKRVTNGTLALTRCQKGHTVISIDLAPRVRVERGWGNTVERSPPSDAMAIVRGPLVFALHPTENKTVVRKYSTEPTRVGDHAPDYLITTSDPWNFGLNLSAPIMFSPSPSPKWKSSFAYDDSSEYPFSITVWGCQVSSWGYWKGSNITAPPPLSPIPARNCGPQTLLRLVPFGSTNIRISVFPWV